MKDDRTYQNIVKLIIFVFSTWARLIKINTKLSQKFPLIKYLNQYNTFILCCLCSIMFIYDFHILTFICCLSLIIKIKHPYNMCTLLALFISQIRNGFYWLSSVSCLIMIVYAMTCTLIIFAEKKVSKMSVQLMDKQKLTQILRYICRSRYIRNKYIMLKTSIDIIKIRTNITISKSIESILFDNFIKLRYMSSTFECFFDKRQYS